MAEATGQCFAQTDHGELPGLSSVPVGEVGGPPGGPLTALEAGETGQLRWAHRLLQCVMVHTSMVRP